MADFNRAIEGVLEDEGGYVNSKNDDGGETKYGISKRSYPNLDIKNLTLDQAKGIYFHDFWKFGGVVSQPIADKVFVTYVNMKHDGIKILQRLVNVADDGFYGPKTEAAVNLQDPYTLLSRYRIALVQHYLEIVQAHPEKAEFLKGWLRRARQ